MDFAGLTLLIIEVFLLFFDFFDQLKYGELLCFCLNFNGNIQVQPGFGEVFGVNIIMVISRISIFPGIQGARNMKKWFAIPGF